MLQDQANTAAQKLSNDASANLIVGAIVDGIASESPEPLTGSYVVHRRLGRAMKAANLNGTDRCVALALWTARDFKTGFVRISRESLAEIAAIDVRNVRRHVRALQESGIIAVKSGIGRHNVGTYQFNPDLLVNIKGVTCDTFSQSGSDPEKVSPQLEKVSPERKKVSPVTPESVVISSDLEEEEEATHPDLAAGAATPQDQKPSQQTASLAMQIAEEIGDAKAKLTGWKERAGIDVLVIEPDVQALLGKSWTAEQILSYAKDCKPPKSDATRLMSAHLMKGLRKTPPDLSQPAPSAGSKSTVGNASKKLSSPGASNGNIYERGPNGTAIHPNCGGTVKFQHVSDGPTSRIQLECAKCEKKLRNYVIDGEISAEHIERESFHGNIQYVANNKYTAEQNRKVPPCRNCGDTHGFLGGVMDDGFVRLLCTNERCNSMSKYTPEELNDLQNG